MEDAKPYLCRWASSDLSDVSTNWIPTNGWPSVNVEVYVRPGSMSNLFIGVRGGWEPAEDRSIAITITRGSLGSGVEPGCLIIGDKTIATFQSSSTRRRYVLRWVAEAKAWMLDVYSLNYQNDSFNSSGTSDNTLLPNDFLPEIDE